MKYGKARHFSLYVCMLVSMKESVAINKITAGSLEPTQQHNILLDSHVEKSNSWSYGNFSDGLQMWDFASFLI